MISIKKLKIEGVLILLYKTGYPELACIFFLQHYNYKIVIVFLQQVHEQHRRIREHDRQF
jgi:hypothetical protein